MKPPEAAAGGSAERVDKGAISELREIYAKHSPDKSEAEVAVILFKFRGREKELLGRVRAKYVASVSSDASSIRGLN